jgi:hypothetical protein
VDHRGQYPFDDLGWNERAEGQKGKARLVRPRSTWKTKIRLLLRFSKQLAPVEIFKTDLQQRHSRRLSSLSLRSINLRPLLGSVISVLVLRRAQRALSTVREGLSLVA